MVNPGSLNQPEMIKRNSQLLNSFLIIVGGAMLMMEIAGEKQNVYIRVAGIILLMFGLYRATRFWVDTKDDHLEEEEHHNDKKEE